MLDLRSGGHEWSLWLYRTACFLPRWCTPRNSSWKCAARFFKFGTYFMGEKNEHALFHTGFQSWPRKATPVFRLGLKDLCIVCQLNRELKQRSRRRQRERQKSNRFYHENNNFARVTLFCTFLCRRCTTTPWNFPISCFVEDANAQKRFSFFLF